MTLPPLDTRTALPDALRVLLTDYPRADWAAHDHFHGLAAFWMDRHLAFRDMTARMQDDTQAMLDRRLDPEDFAARLSRRGNLFLEHLHGHHQIEDSHFFPQLSRMEPGLTAGFDLFESDHQAIDRHLMDFVAAANPVLTSWQDPVALATAADGFLAVLSRVTNLLDRHLVDEEDLVVPVILRHGPDHLG